MSAHAKQKRLTTASIRQMKGEARIVCLTAYTTPIARLLDPHCDLLLVGDSLGMVLYGMDTTVGVTLDMMIAHGRAVMRGVERACVIVDLPFGTYQESREQAFRNAVRVMQETGCDGVKLEGGEEMAETIAFLVARGIPVFGHVGLMPQLVHTMRRLPLARPFGCGNAKNLARCNCGRSGRRFRHRRGRHRRAACPRIGGKTLRPHYRHRRIMRPATGRCWFPTTCSACFQTSNRNSSNDMPISARRLRKRPRLMQMRCAPVRFRGRSIRFRCAYNRLRGSETLFPSCRT